ncbi:DNA adenine methylase [Elizabethkingia anophelis]|uniref:DNA adenine methylase n=1 Tax=Elizabethkingia anophelis TaxID=1117645 RepID=UPI001DEFD24A|nr:DNA adenine methylase [Elizabethkingia anophelis]EHM7982502.1 DNA adenine methylase [Elizabethkingia anophelis]EHM8033685.1 DNA adenine methylase [Elizabethkingia anophelis]EHZ9536359.1 DNA adenine methylase [Elizabethkingia anophelis]EKU3674269.1 DNA adenine methylase [Elizabethkingia anophelis]EKU4211246.1 DNA adenine methylase [Elizabethkingia anophelis]
MKPLLKYRGGKSKEIPYIEKHIPKYNGRYIEPFFGGGALFFYLEPQKAIINDINTKLMDFYKNVKSDFCNLETELFEIGNIYKTNRKKFDDLKAAANNERVEDNNEILYYQIRDMFNDLVEKKYSDALLYFFINKTAYSGMIRYNAKGEFNVPYGRYAHLNTTLVTREHSSLLSNTEIYNSDYKQIFAMAEKDDFMFLDPPYDCVFSDYGNVEYKEGFNEKNHIELANNYKKLKCKALMVIGRTPLTEELYGDMIIDEYGKSYSVNIRNRFKASASHILISNYNNKTNSFHKFEQKELVL